MNKNYFRCTAVFTLLHPAFKRLHHSKPVNKVERSKRGNPAGDRNDTMGGTSDCFLCDLQQ